MDKNTLYRSLLEAVRELYEERNNRVQKAAYVIKAWQSANRVYIEGWASTDDEDRQKDDVPPEAFLHSLPAYFGAKAPLMLNHQPYQIGYLQKVALIREGKSFYEISHPDDPAEFEYQPVSGTGVYARAVLTHEQAPELLTKAAGFSFAGRAKKRVRKATGGWHLIQIDPLEEVTLAVSPAVPVNPNALIMRGREEHASKH